MARDDMHARHASGGFEAPIRGAAYPEVYRGMVREREGGFQGLTARDSGGRSLNVKSQIAVVDRRGDWSGTARGKDERRSEQRCSQEHPDPAVA